MTVNWYLKVKMNLIKSLPEKYFNGAYIEYRECSDDFTDDDINRNFYFLCDILPGQIGCVWRDTGKKYRLSAGECTTITMIEQCMEFESFDEIVDILLIAYFHDLDSVLTRCLDGKTMGRIHRIMTNRRKIWKRVNDGEYTCYWNKNCKRYLPLQDSDLQIIETEFMKLTMDERINIFESDDVRKFSEHFCRVIDLAFGTKIFSLTTFTFEACERAAEKIDM